MSKHMTIDLGDPLVRDMLGVAAPQYAGKKREVAQLAGDAPDPTGVTSHRGIQATHFLTAGKQEVVVVFGDLLMTVDIYTLPGEPVRVQLICPRCRKHSTITSDRKRIEYEPAAPNPMQKRILEVAGTSAPELSTIADFGRLSIEVFECTWEIGNDPHVVGRLHTGASLCRQRLIIDNNRAWES